MLNVKPHEEHFSLTGQTKDCIIGICYFFTKYGALLNTGRFGRINHCAIWLTSSTNCTSKIAYPCHKVAEILLTKSNVMALNIIKQRSLIRNKNI